MNTLKIEKIQSIIRKMNIDGWLFFDFRNSNDLALSILEIGESAHLTRRFFYFIPANGSPVKIVNAIEVHNLAHLPGTELKYASHTSLFEHLTSILKNVKCIAMEYSPLNAIPYVSKVDAGTIEFVKSFNVEIVSSADMITLLDAVWTDEQYNENIEVAIALTDIVKAAYRLIKEKIIAKETITELDVQKFILNEFDKRKYFTDHPPIVGVNENSANPHYSPTENEFKVINKGDFVLIDLWAKQNKPSGVWADITWNGFIGETIPEKYIKIFNIVSEARDAAFNLVAERMKNKEEIRGYEVDDASRNVIEKAGYGDYFIHRTGHSITTSLHGSGPHMDNFETRDERLLLPGTSFSIEPGIYISGDFGVRSEIDVFIHPDGRVEQTGGERQKELIAILA
ncbi:MAG: M24 family metallopeptidase [Ignavibacteria bacterium]|nr:M24 family metallopeptidase [Ignavibacteria bacterium]